MDAPTIYSITESEIDLDALLAKITLTSTGAAAIFTGMVRGETKRGKPHEGHGSAPLAPDSNSTRKSGRIL